MTVVSYSILWLPSTLSVPHVWLLLLSCPTYELYIFCFVALHGLSPFYSIFTSHYNDLRSQAWYTGSTVQVL